MRLTQQFTYHCSDEKDGHMNLPPFEDADGLRLQLIETCLRLVEAGLVISPYGNVSVAVTAGLLVTPSGIDYHLLKTTDLVVISWGGRQISGTRKPTSEATLHRLVHRHLKHQSVRAVIHTHSLETVKRAAIQKPIPVVTEEMAHHFGGPVNCAPYVECTDHLGLAKAAVANIGDACGVLLGNHGAVVGGRDLAEALRAAKILERAAAIVNANDNCIPIPAELVRKAREYFLTGYAPISA